MGSNLLKFRLKNLSSKSQAHVLYVSGPKGDAEVLFSYGEIVGVRHDGVCHYLEGILRTSRMHIRIWVGERSGAVRGIGDIQSWLQGYFGAPVGAIQGGQ